VQFQDKAWLAEYSVEDEDSPELSGVQREQVLCKVMHLKPNPQIYGYTLLIECEFGARDNVSKTIAQETKIKLGLKSWANYQAQVIKAVQVRKNSNKN